jgi:hypothetical protein
MVQFGNEWYLWNKFYFSSRRAVMLIKSQEIRNHHENKSFRTLIMPHEWWIHF